MNFTSYFLLLLSGLALPSGQVASADLAPRHQQWLKESVHFLISEREKELFLELATEGERDSFIDAFWRRRDPTPDTARNERLEEHQLRLAYADDLFTLNKSRPGRFTDRGRLIIQLGLPTSRDTFDHEGQLFPTELWLYSGVKEPFLPESFYLIFFRPGGFGEFRLWYPVGDGPAALIATPEPNRYFLDRQATYDFFKRIDRELALAIRRLVPGESEDTNLASEEVVARVQGFADLSEDHLSRQRVRTTTSFQILDAESTVALWIEPNGLPSLHYAIEVPSERLTWEEKQDQFGTSFRFECTILDQHGQTFDSFQDDLDIVVSRREYEEGQGRKIQFQGKLFVIPGDFAILFDLRNKTSQRSSYLRHSVQVPEFFGSFMVGGLVLSAAPLHQGPVEGKPFAAGDKLIAPAASVDLHSRKGNRVFVSAYLKKDHSPVAGRWSLYQQTSRVWSREVEILPESAPRQLLEVELPELEAGNYRLRLEAGDAIRFVEFDVTPRMEVPRVRVVNREAPAADDPGLLFALANLLARNDRFETAARLLELAGNPAGAAQMRARAEPR